MATSTVTAAGDAGPPSPSSATTSAPRRASDRLPHAGVVLPAAYDSLPTLTRRDVASRITRGELLVLHPPLVYRVPRQWLDLHPGGPHAVLHYVGRDASCEIEAYHTARTVQERMARWVVGKVDVDDSDQTSGEGWRDMTPPIQLGKWPVPIPTITVSSPPASPARKRTTPPVATAALAAAATGSPVDDHDGKAFEVPAPAAADVLTVDMVDPPLRPEDYDHLPLTPAYQAHLRRSVKRLYARIQSKGLDTPPRFLAGYGPSLIIYVSLVLLSVWSYRRAIASNATFDYLVAAVCLGAFYHQITFVVHDAGHTALTGSWIIDRLWGIGLADFMGGLSVGWWADNHNVHHRKSRSCSDTRRRALRCSPQKIWRYSRHECARARSRHPAPAVLCHLDSVLRLGPLDVLRPPRRVRRIRTFLLALPVCHHLCKAHAATVSFSAAGMHVSQLTLRLGKTGTSCTTSLCASRGSTSLHSRTPSC